MRKINDAPDYVIFVEPTKTQIIANEDRKLQRIHDLLINMLQKH